MAAHRRRPSTITGIALWLALATSGCSLVAPIPAQAPGGASAAGAAGESPSAAAGRALVPGAATPTGVIAQFPRRIALLLPLSGPTAAAAAAIRDGFVAAWLQQDPAARPDVRIYDVAATPLPAAYDAAVADGADFVVGPLTKQSVDALVPLANGRLPVLALNYLPDGMHAPRQFYQFALHPEDEARSVAKRLIADGHPRGVVMVPDGDWGTRVANAFSSELTGLGGAVLALAHYDPTQVDFSDIIRSELQVHEARGEVPSHRPDASFVFVAGPPQITRLVMPQLKFHFAGDLPVYSMPDGYAPDTLANADIDHMFFPDMPWMVGSDPATVAVRDAIHSAWPALATRFDRLYAFGFDAYRLVPALRSGYFDGGAPLAGVTGALSLDRDGRIHRALVWARIQDGIAKPL
ncbi:MAG: penicillin-binding protein activator [Gammaproteobacteria bacterium]|nr:penicillin-binding protein activator [Gammaproteobacteria bacterium]